MDSNQLIKRLNALIEPDIRKLFSKGHIEIPVEEIPISPNDASDILPELIFANLPFDVKLIPRRYTYVFRITAEVFNKEKGFYIYRYFVNGEEVYVGRTNRPAKRYLEHCSDDERYKQVDRIDIHKCKSKADMIFLERILISNDRPPWNIVDMDNGELSYDLPTIKYTQHTPFEIMQRYK